MKSYFELNKKVYICYDFGCLPCLPQTKIGLTIYLESISQLSRLKYSIVIPFVSFIDDVTYLHVKCPVFRCESAISSLFCKIKTSSPGVFLLNWNYYHSSITFLIHAVHTLIGINVHNYEFLPPANQVAAS